jgi:hypothetical protein
MTFTFDPEQAFWWAALAALVFLVGCVLADTGVGIARLVLDLDQQGQARRLAKKPPAMPTTQAD